MHINMLCDQVLDYADILTFGSDLSSNIFFSSWINASNSFSANLEEQTRPFSYTRVKLLCVTITHGHITITCYGRNGVRQQID